MTLDPLDDPQRAPAEIDRLEREIDLRQEAIGALVEEVAARDRELFDARRRAEADQREIARLERIANGPYVRFGLGIFRALRSVRARLAPPKREAAPKPASSAAARPPGATPPPPGGSALQPGPTAEPGSGAAASPVAGAASVPTPVRPKTRRSPADPASARRDLLARIAGAKAEGRALRVAWAGDQAVVDDEIRLLGWERTEAGEADVLVTESPDLDVRQFPDAIAIALIDTPEPWLDRAWIDEFDLVLVGSTSAAAAVRAATAHDPLILAPEDRSPGRIGPALRTHLEAWAGRTGIAILVGVPSWEVAPVWGDTHFGRALQRAFARRGWAARMRIAPDWDAPATRRADVALHLFGLRERTLDPHQVNAVWVISHPDRVTDSLVAGQDLVFVASKRFAVSLAERTGRPIEALAQATDPERFSPTAGPDGPATELLYVANSRGVRRRIVADLTPTTYDLAVYGQKWRPTLLDPRYLRAEGIPNATLAGAYRSASIVLNDHWPDMAEHGFLSNRLYDALASGGFVVSDHVDEMEREFDGAVPTYRTPRELRSIIRRFLADPAARRDHADRGRQAVVARHTFDHRVDELIARIEPLLEQRRSG